jgi:hypothetical protein
MKQSEQLKEFTIRSLNLSGTSVLKLEKEKDRVEYEAVSIQLLAGDMLTRGCNMEETCFPYTTDKPDVPDVPPPPPCPHTPDPDPDEPKPDEPKPDPEEPKPNDTPL